MVLSEADLRQLVALGHRMDVRPAPGGRWTLRPKGIVGRLQLGDRTLDLRAKLPLANLCRMLEVVAGVPRLLDPTTALGGEGLPELIIAAFVERTEALLTAGLRRDYVRRHERLPLLRGRLDLPAHVRRPEALITQLDCRHEDYTLHTPFNAVLRQAAETCHSRWPALAPRLLRLRHRLGSLPRSALTPEQIERFEYDRLTSAYRPVHALCRLILSGTTVGLDEHDTAGSSFVVDMAPLFERFVSQALGRRLGPALRVELQERTSLDQRGVIGIRPDIVVFDDERAVTVLDAKYKVRSRGVPTQSDAYQVLAYARRYRARRGWLVYPDRPAGAEVLVVHDGNNEIASHGLDLGTRWDDVQAQLDQLADGIRTDARRGDHARAES